MPYSLTVKPPERSTAVWEGEDGSDPGSRIPQRRVSISTAGELNFRPTHFLCDEEVVQRDVATPSKVNLTSSTVTTSRVERLVREQHLRRNGRCHPLGDESEGRIEGPGGNGGMGGGGGDRRGGGVVEPGVISNNNQGTGVRMDGFESTGNLTDKGQRATQRLLVVANRLPVSAIRDGDTWDLKLSAGGLVSALLGVKQNFETRWIGWAGVSVQDVEGRSSLKEALSLKGCVPVFLDDDTVDQYYNGYCNNVLWPLFHYIGLPQDDRLAATRSLDSQFKAYENANKLFADVVYSEYQDGDVVWCHDYHLMCLPKCLKELDSRMKVGWFLHTPFPSSEIYRTLPLRSELLKAVLAADLIGFHTYDYARHFVSACTRILGLEGTPEGVEDQGRLTRVAAFPIGIDPERFIQALETDQVKQHIVELLRFFAGRKVMLGVDRLDMIKGIPQKLLAFEMFLEKNPEWQEKVMLVQIAVPTRTDVPEYQRLTSHVHEIVGRINGRYGSVTYTPIHHLDRSLAFHELCALYASTDVALVTSLRDGMNLVSYEYVACQNLRATEGVLVLSEFAGAAQSLGAGAILVNPWNIRAMYKAIDKALNMPDTERRERHLHNFAHVTKHTAQSWADTFVSELNDTIVEAELRTLRIPPDLPVELAVEKFQNANSRLLIAGFNSTITGQVDDPRRRGDQIREMKLGLHPGMKESLATLCADPNTIIIVLSGSERGVLDETFGDYNMWLAAENGMYLRHTRGEWNATLEHKLDMDWVESVQLVFDYFCARTPRSYVESRETSLVWNYKYADMEFGRVQARNMLQHLWTGPISNAAVDVVQGSRSVEVRPIGVSKGAAIHNILSSILENKEDFHIDYVACIGHFLSKILHPPFIYFPVRMFGAARHKLDSMYNSFADTASNISRVVKFLKSGFQDEDVFTYFDPEPHFSSDHHASSAGDPLDPRLAAKVGNRSLSKTSKMGVVRTKTYPLISPDRISTSSPSRSNSFKDRKYSERDSKEDLGKVIQLTSATYFSCAVGRKRSSARWSLASSEEVVLFFKALADTFKQDTRELDIKDEPAVLLRPGL